MVLIAADVTTPEIRVRRDMPVLRTRLTMPGKADRLTFRVRAGENRRSRCRMDQTEIGATEIVRGVLGTGIGGEGLGCLEFRRFGALLGGELSAVTARMQGLIESRHASDVCGGT